MSDHGQEPDFVGFPMHGESKLRREGLRTRDAHLLETLAATGATVRVVSRAEPWPRVTSSRRVTTGELPRSWEVISPEPFVLPWHVLRDRRQWWVESARWIDPRLVANKPVLAWNVFAAARLGASRLHTRLVVDLLDDWTIHPAFAGIAKEVDRAYASVFDAAHTITANSEATVDLAARYGRPDAVLLPNGVDPSRFALARSGESPRTIIGYGGKIGFRLDLPMIRAACQAHQDCDFEFSGPVLDRQVGRELRRLPNVRLLGDVHYARYPEVVASWDIGWVPHRTGSGEIGGDVIKVYEYRAAGLPTVSAPILGAGRVGGVVVAEAEEVVEAIQALRNVADGARVPRQPTTIPSEHTWAEKARTIAQALGIDREPDRGT